MTATEKTTATTVEVKAITTPPAPVSASATPVAAAAAATPVVAVKAARKVAAKKVVKKPATPVTESVKPVAKAVAKPVLKAAPKTTAKPAAKAAPKLAVKPVTTPKAEKSVKAKKPKLVRDSFTIPKAEYTVLDDLKQRAGKLASAVKKSELIRAGVKALAAMSDAAFLAALKVVPTIKTGRPSKARD